MSFKILPQNIAQDQMYFGLICMYSCTQNGCLIVFLLPLIFVCLPLYQDTECSLLRTHTWATHVCHSNTGHAHDLVQKPSRFQLIKNRCKPQRGWMKNMIIIFRKFKMKNCPCQAEVFAHFCKICCVISRTAVQFSYHKVLICEMYRYC